MNNTQSSKNQAISRGTRPLQLAEQPNRNKAFDKYIESKIKIEKEYIQFIEDFIGDIDEDKKCKWMFKNNNNK